MCSDYSVFDENTYEDLYLLCCLALLMEQRKVNVRDSIEVDTVEVCNTKEFAPVVLVGESNLW